MVTGGSGLRPPHGNGRRRSLAPQSEDGAVPGFGIVAGEVIHDVFDHGVLVQGVGRHVLAEAGLLHATVRHFADDRDVVP